MLVLEDSTAPVSLCMEDHSCGTIFVALLWTFSILLMSCSNIGLHTEFSFSKCCQIRTLWKVRRFDVLAKFQCGIKCNAKVFLFLSFFKIGSTFSISHVVGVGYILSPIAHYTIVIDIELKLPFFCSVSKTIRGHLVNYFHLGNPLCVHKFLCRDVVRKHLNVSFEVVRKIIYVNHKENGA